MTPLDKSQYEIKVLPMQGNITLYQSVSNSYIMNTGTCLSWTPRAMCGNGSCSYCSEQPNATCDTQTICEDCNKAKFTLNGTAVDCKNEGLKVKKVNFKMTENKTNVQLDIDDSHKDVKNYQIVQTNHPSGNVSSHSLTIDDFDFHIENNTMHCFTITPRVFYAILVKEATYEFCYVNIKDQEYLRWISLNREYVGMVIKNGTNEFICAHCNKDDNILNDFQCFRCKIVITNRDDLDIVKLLKQ
ncbi:unnamed protein product [Gordionus sp. m RMFG-2023]